MYGDDKIVSYERSWHVEVDNAEAGVIVPGTVQHGLIQYQEVASEVAEDRAQIIGLREIVNTPARAFESIPKKKYYNVFNIFNNGYGLT